MGYRDDFYCLQNVHGFTGRLGHYPTIYFVKRTAFGSYYGHITQQHDKSSNVGRLKVYGPDPTYRAANGPSHGRIALVERNLHGIFHTSRSLLTSRDEMTATAWALCAQAIRDNPNEKYMTWYSGEDRDLIRAQRGFHALITPAALQAQKERNNREQKLREYRHLMQQLDTSAGWARRNRGL